MHYGVNMHYDGWPCINTRLNLWYSLLSVHSCQFMNCNQYNSWILQNEWYCTSETALTSHYADIWYKYLPIQPNSSIYVNRHRCSREEKRVHTIPARELKCYILQFLKDIQETFSSLFLCCQPKNKISYAHTPKKCLNRSQNYTVHNDRMNSLHIVEIEN